MFSLIIVAAASIGVFLVVFQLAGVVPVAKRAITESRGAIQAMRDPDLDELTRERTVQKAAIQLLIVSGSIILRSLLALAAAFIPIVLADWVGIASRAATLAFMERWDVILIASLVVIFGYVAGICIWSR